MPTRIAERPVVRVQQSRHSGELIIKLTRDMIEIRPLGSRREDAKVYITTEALYERLLLAR